MAWDGILLYASGAAYDIDPADGKYKPDGPPKDTIYAPNVGFVSSTIQAFAAPSYKDGPRINACLVGCTSTEIIVAFRGTIPSDTTLAGIEDWLQDFFAEPASCGNLPGNVHEGFYDAVKSIYEDLQAYVKQLVNSSKLPVYITGHSKGGGMAPLAAYMLHADGIAIARVATFAGPKCGDATFAAAYDAIFSDVHVRYENFGDLVPFCPPSDDVIGWIADAVWYVSEDLYDLIEEASGWNYVSVGSESYIEQPVSGVYAIVTDETIQAQATDFILNLGWNLDDPGTALWDAHTIAPGFGYFSSLCPNPPSTSTFAAFALETSGDDAARKARWLRPLEPGAQAQGASTNLGDSKRTP